MLTMKAKYALKALAHLAAAPPGTSVLSMRVAESEGIPHKFLEMILRELRQRGFVDSRKGKGGGYQLRRAASTISLAEVIRIFDGPIAPVACLSTTNPAECEGCPAPALCGVRLALRESYEASLRVLERTSIADMVALQQEARCREEERPLSYCI